MIDFTKQLAVIRKSSKAFAQGEMKFLSCTPEECVFARIDKLNREAAVIFLNKSKYPKTFKLDDYMKGEYTDPKFLRKPHESGEKTIKLSPFDYGVLVCSI